MRNRNATLPKLLVIVGLAFGILTFIPAMPAAAQDAVNCQYNLDGEGNVVNQQLVPSQQACADLFAESPVDGGCTVTDADGDGFPEGASGGADCTYQPNEGAACQIQDNDGDGAIENVQGNCDFDAAEVPTATQTVEPTATVIETTTPVATTPATQPTTPAATQTATQPVDDLPDTGSGPSDRHGSGLVLALGVLSALMLAAAFAWQRRVAG